MNRISSKAKSHFNSRLKQDNTKMANAVPVVPMPGAGVEGENLVAVEVVIQDGPEQLLT